MRVKDIVTLLYSEFYVSEEDGIPFLVEYADKKDFRHFYDDATVLAITTYKGKVLLEVY